MTSYEEARASIVLGQRLLDSLCEVDQRFLLRLVARLEARAITAERAVRMSNVGTPCRGSMGQ